MSSSAVESVDLERESASRAAATTTTIERSLAFGVLAMMPLFVVYEGLQRSGAAPSRNTAEYLLSLPLLPFGAHAPTVRLLLLVVILAACIWRTYRAEFGLIARIGRVVVEGFVAALLLGPLFVWLQHALELPLPPLAAASSPALGDALHHAGGAAFEEIVFRVGMQSALFLLFLQIFLFFTDQRSVSRAAAEIAALFAGALIFAAAHLAPVVQLFGAGGEPFVASVFAWRVIAGLALGILFRVRGPGVAAWTHALFNMALYVGAGPDVFL